MIYGLSPANGNEDILAGHPRPSYAEVQDIDAMAAALRSSLGKEQRYSCFRSWWDWDRLRARYVDGECKDKGALKILQAAFGGLILGWHARLKAKGELLSIFFTSLSGDGKESRLDAGRISPLLLRGFTCSLPTVRMRHLRSQG